MTTASSKSKIRFLKTSEDAVHERSFLHPHPCQECFKSNKNKSFRTKYQLKAHAGRCHGSARAQFSCEICLKSYTEIRTLDRHKRSVHSQVDRINCSICHSSLANLSSLQTHMFSIHKLKTGNFNSAKCELCSKIFISKSLLEAHVVEKHVVDKEFECSVCSKRFIDLQSLESHKKQKHEQMAIVCDVCSVDLSPDRASLHFKYRHPKFTYCSKCRRSFINKSEYNQHVVDVVTNSGDIAAFKCQICNLPFTSQCNLDCHTNSHIQKLKSEQNIYKSEITGDEGPAFKCQHCCEDFVRESNLFSHQKNIHGIIHTWKCSFKTCWRSFQSYALLQRHEFNQHGLKANIWHEPPLTSLKATTEQKPTKS